MLSPGTRIWAIIRGEGLPPFSEGPFLITSFKQFLPAASLLPTIPSQPGFGERKKSLVQVYTDHGMRTLAVAEIRLKDPRRSL
jgi:hypothetical protein